MFGDHTILIAHSMAMHDTEVLFKSGKSTHLMESFSSSLDRVCLNSTSSWLTTF